ncbi:D-glycerate dehydrogenase [Aquibacillus sp. 3ASR75-11]|uniref:D-glycerate dehydrogenase n=1 Tax=Terrihalobacillus insolitus TaxID=2950438 RepID=A0A9X3WTA0_9BACI|nr:D-glycerate dehydrogenase [Terrihalobacillus insolitus]MDC3412363.1 D-glycerate dehydrogenase [Terrihalobacillus insolitus]MDC3422944.1 D-glycerate dehydrogenase [Terrihalobacillus insolitus]
MTKPRLYITRKLPEHIVGEYRQYFDIKMWPYEEKSIERKTLMEESQKSDAIVSMLTDELDKDFFMRMKQLKVVANFAVGYDNIDVKAAKQQGIIVTNTPDVLTETTADLTFGLLLSTARRIVEASDYVKKDKWKNWSPFLLAGTDVHHKKIGIVGMGRIGEAVARRAQGFEMEIVYYNRSRKRHAEESLGATYLSFDNLLEQADYVVCLAPLSEETKNLFNKNAFKRMKQSAIFINASRGQVVNENHLYEALMQGEIRGAGLDVYTEEPIRNTHPLLALDQVICLPHIGSASIETREAMAQLCLENIRLVIQGKEPKTPVFN